MTDNAEEKKDIIVFYFPWREVSGGPIYLARLANSLAERDTYEVYYTDYHQGLSDSLLSQNVRKLTVSEQDFSIPIDEKYTIITPIYWACWLPQMNPACRIVYVNWHVSCVPVLQNTWGINDDNLNNYLSLVQGANACFFCDLSHWLGQNRNQIIFDKTIVPISVPSKKREAANKLISDDAIEIGVLSRLCADKIYSIINLLDNLQKIKTTRRKVVHIIGDGPDSAMIRKESYPEISIYTYGTVVGDELNDILEKKIDILFAMGTSVLEGAALHLPCVIMPHNMHPMECDAFVYLHKSVGYCLGWYDTQMAQLGIVPMKLSSIIDDIYERNKKKVFGEAAYSYLLSHHDINVSSPLLQNAIKSSKLTYAMHVDAAKNYHAVEARFNGKIKFALFGIPILQTSSNPDNNETLVLLLKWPILVRRGPKKDRSYRLLAHHYLYRKLVHFTVRLPILRQWQSLKNNLNNLERGLSEVKYHLDKSTLEHKENVKNFESLERGLSEVKYHLDKSTLEHKENVKNFESLERGLSEVKYHLDKSTLEHKENVKNFESLERGLSEVNSNILQMDTCDWLLTEESFLYFCGDIREDYINLIIGLDDLSLKVIARIISRIRTFREYKTSYFRFTKDELQEWYKIIDQHSSRIVPLAPDCFAYGRFLLPRAIITTSIFYYEHFLNELENLSLVRESTIIDAGGFIGDSALILSRYTNHQVHVFEPVKEMQELTSRTIAMNNICNVVINNVALGAKHETRNITLASDASTFRITEMFNAERCKQEEVDVITLDAYVTDKGLKVGLIKIDVEGFEQPLLLGAKQTICTQKPALLVSIYHSADDFFHVKTLIESWNLGYKFKIRKPSDFSIIVDTVLIAEVR